MKNKSTTLQGVITFFMMASVVALVITLTVIVINIQIMKVEFKEIELNSTEAYTASNYPSEGFFVVNDVDVKIKSLIYVKGDLVWFMLTEDNVIDFNSFKVVEDTKVESQDNTVSEDLFLKAMSLMVNKDESYK